MGYMSTYHARKDAGLCVHCGKCPPRQDKRHCITCADKINSAKNQRYQRSDSAQAVSRARAAKWQKANPEKRRANTARWRMMQWDMALDAYGRQCACCGESESKFLTIDHVDGGGNQHRSKVGKGSDFYRWLYKNNYPPGFQVLCWNCNCAKGIRGGCPHELLRET